MRPPTLFVRPLNAGEHQRLQAGLRSSEAFTLRRCQILLASASGHSPARIARNRGCTAVSVRNAIHAFHSEGLDCLREKSSRPKTAHTLLVPDHADVLRLVLHLSPRLYGFARSTWTLALLAEVCHRRGWTPRVLSIEAIRQAIARLGGSWRRAKRWIRSPDPAYARKKHARDRLLRLAESHPEWVLGFQDETWWWRLALPSLSSWTAAQPLQLVEQDRPKGDLDPKALCCYGLLRADTQQMLLRFVSGRPVSQVTEDYLGWVCEQLASEGKKALLLVWDNASWHTSVRVRDWIKAHNQRVRQEGGVRIVVCGLPVKAPWLNRIEPQWVHGKKAITEPERLLSAAEVEARVCEYYDCDQEEHLIQIKTPKKTSTKRKKVA
jgi:transposase